MFITVQGLIQPLMSLIWYVHIPNRPNRPWYVHVPNKPEQIPEQTIFSHLAVTYFSKWPNLPSTVQLVPVMKLALQISPLLNLLSLLKW